MELSKASGIWTSAQQPLGTGDHHISHRPTRRHQPTGSRQMDPAQHLSTQLEGMERRLAALRT
jgi:hypothetical protein